MKTNTELKRIAIAALKSEYGFAPAQKDITLLEADGEGTHILFKVNGKEYSFNSYVWDSFGTIWCGAGTIEKVM